jgi:hypothetical protein
MSIKDFAWMCIAMGAITLGSLHWQRTNEIAAEREILHALELMGIPSGGMQPPGLFAPEHDGQDLRADGSTGVLDCGMLEELG